MKDDQFESLDREMQEKFKSLHQIPVPSRAREGFSQSVTDRILREKKPGISLGITVPVFAAAFILMMGLGIWYFAGQVRGKSRGVEIPVTESRQVQKMEAVSAIEKPSLDQSQGGDLQEEVLLLEELGVWSEEDEAAIGMTVEESLDDFDVPETGADIGMPQGSPSL